MRKLNRTAVAVPACLAAYSHPAHCWDDVTSTDKAQIHVCLEQMQGRRCAYCEGSLDMLGRHIEHFRRKGQGHFPQLAFDWTNLYWSCDQTDSCGHYKDNGAGPYNIADLIEPCVDDPDKFFRFRSDGTISIRLQLTQAERHKAEETLRVFNLNPKWGRLRNMRKQAVSGYIRDVEEAINAGFTPDDLKEYFQEALQIATTLPFPTTVRHVLSEGA
jgi:uncharacterized protein (TIGR02646 family)